MRKPSLQEVLEHPIVQALNPQGREFVWRRQLTSRLNPFAADSSMSALIAFGEFPHIKCVPALQMLMTDFLEGCYEDKHTIVVDSSGNTALAVARLAPAFGFSDVVVVMSADVPAAKKNVFAALSTPTVVSVPKGQRVADVARELGRKPGHYHLNQYAHKGNMQAHEMYTGPAIAQALDNSVGIVAIAMGSGGTAGGVGRFLREHCPQAIVIGVRPKLGEQVPGARDKQKMADVVTFPWNDSVNHIIEVSRKEAFVATRELWKEVEPQPGPTSGLAYAGLVKYLEYLESVPHLSELSRGKTTAFLCPDSSSLYSDVIIAELDTGQGL